MSLETDVADYMAGQSDIAGAVVARIYQEGSVPANVTFPCLTFLRISTEHLEHLTAAAGLAVATFQVDVWASTSASRETASEAVRQAFSGMHHTTWTSTDVRRTDLEGPTYSFEPSTVGKSKGAYRARHEVTVWYAESVPTF